MLGVLALRRILPRSPADRRPIPSRIPSLCFFGRPLRLLPFVRPTRTADSSFAAKLSSVLHSDSPSSFFCPKLLLFNSEI